MKSKKIIIIGHRGFIGSEIFNQLKSKKNKLVGFSSKELDLKNSKTLAPLKKKLSEDSILIVTASINRELGDNLKNMVTHISMLTNLARILGKTKIAKCVYLSSIDVYGYPDKLPVDENSPANPQSLYGIAKYACEKTLAKVCTETETPFLILRYNGIFGPGQKITGYGVNNFIKSIIDQKKVYIWGDGAETRDPVYVADLAKIIISLVFNKAEGIFNIASGKSLSFMQILNIIRKVSPIPFKIIHKKRTSPSFSQRYNTKKLKKVLPIFGFTPLDKAIKDTFAFYQSQLKKGEKLNYA